MRADRVAVDARVDGADHRPALARRRRAPADRKARRDAAAPRMRGEPDMVPRFCFVMCFDGSRPPQKQ